MSTLKNKMILTHKTQNIILDNLELKLKLWNRVKRDVFILPERRFLNLDHKSTNHLVQALTLIHTLHQMATWRQTTNQGANICNMYHQQKSTIQNAWITNLNYKKSDNAKGKMSKGYKSLCGQKHNEPRNTWKDAQPH